MDEEPQLAPLTVPPSLEALDSEGRIEAMVAWFFENFEDPAYETPYDGREGGYQYIWGGPHEAADYIYDHFPEATEEEHSEAIQRIDADGPYWAPAGHRVLPPDEDFDERPAPSLEERLAALAGQLDVLTGHVGEMLALQQKGVGTQNGPRYTLRFCRAFDGAHLAKRSERGGWRIGIGPEVIAGEIDMLPTER